MVSEDIFMYQLTYKLWGLKTLPHFAGFSAQGELEPVIWPLSQGDPASQWCHVGTSPAKGEARTEILE